jgi:carboxyl-terminal processing protease
MALRPFVFALLGLLVALPAAAAAPSTSVDYRADARSIEALINAHYAYLDRFHGARMPLTERLRAEAGRVTSQRELLRYAERALMLLADHHAITGASLKDSWAVFPSFGDLWIRREGASFRVTAVRDGSPAAAAGVRPGDLLLAVDGKPTPQAVADFWRDLGARGGGERDAFAARVLAAGRRDRPRRMTFGRAGRTRDVTLPSLYAIRRPPMPPVTSSTVGGDYRIRFHDSLGDSATIAAFDAAMAGAGAGQRLVIDLTDTPSGGNTSVARAVLGWFVRRPTFYQVHNLPAEERETGIARQWVEQVLPRAGKYRAGPVLVRVGRWTGSMGEGLAIGCHAIGARVEGQPMAGLLGAIYDDRLEQSGLVIKLPTERLSATDGTPREKFVPEHPASTR